MSDDHYSTEGVAMMCLACAIIGFIFAVLVFGVKL